MPYNTYQAKGLFGYLPLTSNTSEYFHVRLSTLYHIFHVSTHPMGRRSRFNTRYHEHSPLVNKLD